MATALLEHRKARWRERAHPCNSAGPPPSWLSSTCVCVCVCVCVRVVCSCGGGRRPCPGRCPGHDRHCHFLPPLDTPGCRGCPGCVGHDLPLRHAHCALWQGTRAGRPQTCRPFVSLCCLHGAPQQVGQILDEITLVRLSHAHAPRRMYALPRTHLRSLARLWASAL